MLRRHIGNYNFVGDAKTGITLRWGKTINDNPVFAPVPELADISISNHCTMHVFTTDYYSIFYR